MAQARSAQQDLRFHKTVIDPIRHVIENKQLGITFEDLLTEINYTPEAYENTAFTLSAEEFLALHRALKRHISGRIRIRDWLSYYSATSAGLAGMASLSAGTIREAMLVPVKYMPLYVPAIKVELQETRYKSRLSLEMVADLKELNHFLLETVTGVFNIIANQVAANEIPRTIHFRHSYNKKTDHAKLEEIEGLFGFKVCFNSTFNGIEGDRHWLDEKTRSPNGATYHIAKQALDQELEQLYAKQSFSTYVRNELNTLAKQGLFPTLEQFADRINLSPRTLIRKLAIENTSFKTLGNEVWFALAKDLLRNTNLSVKQVASKSGYKSVDSFGRAFKALTDVTPREWQKAQCP